MRTRMKTQSIIWQLIDNSPPEAFYHGETVTDATPPPSALCLAVRERIRERLKDRVRDLDVATCEGGIVISGRCANYHTKQLAQHAALDVMNNEPLENRIEVYVP